MTTASKPSGIDFKLIEARSRLIDESVALIDETTALYQARGEVDEGRLKSLQTLKKSTSDDQLKIATIGEYSRGKSSLINALLGESVLPTAQEQTTAINCFVSGLNEEYPKPCIEIHYLSGKKERLDYSYEALEAWSTELNKENQDARLEVDRIHLHTAHPLFQNRVTLIDTPGFQGILERHEKIAREAMDEAHIALWVQSTEQLGGNKTEWDFMRQSVAKNFNRFLTVVNMWDSVLEPSALDQRAQRMSSAEWERSKLDHVQQQFKTQGEGTLTSEQLARVTSDENLFGVSAHWALSDEPSKRGRSNIQRLARRIEEMVAEGQTDKLITPLRKLLHEHLEPLIKSTKERSSSLQEDRSLEDRQRTLEQLSMQITQLELSRDRQLEDTRQEHTYHLNELLGELTQLSEPIKQLKLELDHSVTEDYVRRVLERAIKNNQAAVVSLSDDHLAEFERCTNAVQTYWPSFKRKTEERLQALAAEFMSQMQESARGVLEGLSGVSFEFPDVNVSVEADLTEVTRYQGALAEHNAQIEAEEERLEELELKMKRGEITRDELERERAERERSIQAYRARIAGLGQEPPPEKSPIYGSSGGWKSKPKIVDYDIDTSARDHHREMVKELKGYESSEAASLQKIKAEFSAQNHQRLSDEAAAKKLRQRQAKLERELKRLEEQQLSAIEDQISSAHRALRRQTVRQLERLQNLIEEQAQNTLTRVFEGHQELLKQAVEEHFMIPIREKRQEQEEVNSVIAQGKDEVASRLQELDGILKKASELVEVTEYMINESIPNTFA